MRHALILSTLLAVSLSAAGQHIVEGRVTTTSGRAIPYATLQFVGTSVGVVCNDVGEFMLRVPPDSPSDSIEVRSLGYATIRVPLAALVRRQRRNQLRLESLMIDLAEVDVKEYRSSKSLLKAALRQLQQNYHRKPSISIFFCRDWRAIDGQMYLFDESVMSMWRAGYGHFNSKRGYAFVDGQREMPTDYKSLLRHRTAVCDYGVVRPLVHRNGGAEMLMQYDDNTRFHDPLSAPQASILFADNMLKRQTFEPTMQYTAGDETFYIVRAHGTSKQGSTCYQYTIRKADLAIVDIVSSHRDVFKPAPQDEWVNTEYNRMQFEIDSSTWHYEQLDGRYVLTHYYNYKGFRLVSSGRSRHATPQHHQMCIDWRLTDFTAPAPSLPPADTISATVLSMADALGHSDFDPSFWGQYQTISIDTMPARLLYEALRRNKK